MDKFPVVCEKKTNEKRRQEVTERIIGATVELFTEQGYEKTTMRQIAMKAGILNGSLYNIFDSKEDIFKMIIDNGYKSVLRTSNELLSDNDNIVVALAFPLCVDLHLACTTHRSAEILHEAHNSWNITMVLIEITETWVSSYLKKYNVDIDSETLRFNLIALFGCLGNFISRIYFEERKEYRAEMKAILELFCTMFRLPAFNIDQIVDRMMALMNAGTISFADGDVRVNEC